MLPMSRLMRPFAAPLLLALAATATAQDANIKQPVADLERLLAAEPLVITQAEISRPKAKGDITLKADVSFGGAPPLRVKLRKSSPARIPSTTSRATTLRRTNCRSFPRSCRVRGAAHGAAHGAAGGLRKVLARSQTHVSGADQVVAVVQYWLSDIKVIADVYDPRVLPPTRSMRATSGS